jgi:predicted methyltransferase
LFIFASLGLADELRNAVDSKDRSEKNIVRDEFRKPYETLSFFQLEPDMTIVELSPGGGWYTEILANFIRKSGNLIAAHFSKDSDRAYFRNSRINFEKKVKENNLYEKVMVVDLNSKLSDPSSVDAILTFSNLHNCLGPNMDKIFSNSYVALKSGGLLGIVEHRAKAGTSMEDMKKSGYVTEQHAIKIAKKHGFELLAKSEINANPKDSADHPRGVWTLPPVLRLKEKDKEKYLAIGESDRMTLLFRKPKS